MSKCKADQRKFSFVSGLFPAKVKFCRYDLSHVHTTPSRPASANPIATALETRSIEWSIAERESIAVHVQVHVQLRSSSRDKSRDR